jgi:predicted transcriptional regulator
MSATITMSLENAVSTTTIRLPEDLKARVSIAADKAGSTAHSFIIDAIAEKIEQVEHRTCFHEEAERRFTEFAESGKTIPWAEMRSYLQERVKGRNKNRPKPRKLAR